MAAPHAQPSCCDALASGCVTGRPTHPDSVLAPCPIICLPRQPASCLSHLSNWTIHTILFPSGLYRQHLHYFLSCPRRNPHPLPYRLLPIGCVAHRLCRCRLLPSHFGALRFCSIVTRTCNNTVVTVKVCKQTAGKRKELGNGHAPCGHSRGAARPTTWQPALHTRLCCRRGCRHTAACLPPHALRTLYHMLPLRLQASGSMLHSLTPGCRQLLRLGLHSLRPFAHAAPDRPPGRFGLLLHGIWLVQLRSWGR